MSFDGRNPPRESQTDLENLKQVNVTAVWLSLRPNWRSEASRAEFTTHHDIY